jgi:spore germination protein PC
VPVLTLPTEFIKNDVARQLRGRIEMYINNTSQAERSSGQINSVKEIITEKLKTDIQHAIHQFIANSQTTAGGVSPNAI